MTTSRRTAPVDWSMPPIDWSMPTAPMRLSACRHKRDGGQHRDNANKPARCDQNTHYRCLPSIHNLRRAAAAVGQGQPKDHIPITHRRAVGTVGGMTPTVVRSLVHVKGVILTEREEQALELESD